MKSKPHVSVIVPTHNSAKYIQETIKPILKQTYTNIEIIVVDDGFTDNTRKVLKPNITKK